ncbi:MAG TPA: PhzF family phenazine biosynthesis protein [Gemmatimonadaceae bacterium]|nr:PhzF family phenazine biosynthesis protein [Gemmatimonadaceae bacterium]
MSPAFRSLNHSPNVPYVFYTADVFTDTLFGGNQLGILPDARGLTSEQMLSITREFNYSESTFVFPPNDPKHTRRVRIFTPGGELPFAGHPTVGTAHVLAAIGEIPLTGDETQIVFEEGVGPVPVVIRARNGKPDFCQLSVAKLPQVSEPPVTRADLAGLLSLELDDLLEGEYSPQIVSCGLPFLLVPVRDRKALARSRLKLEPWERMLQGTPSEMVMLFAADPERPGSDMRARMYGPAVSIVEDPATGSACACLAGYLAARTPRDGTLRWVVEQGFEMGRPSIIEIEADKAAGSITAVRVGGRTVLVSKGQLLAI